jgi:DNA invertase Pin-like site-specific DNA recombinase
MRRSTARVRLEAAGVGVVVAADGLLAFAFGAPWWLAAAYLALAGALAVCWVRVARPAASPREPRAVAQEPRAVAQEQGERLGPARRRVVGYVYIDGDDLQERKAEIREWCEQHDGELSTIVHDTEQVGDDHNRPSLTWALAQIANAGADALVVARLRDLSHNVANLTPLLRWFTEPDRSLVALDIGLDTATEAGQMTATALAGVGGWERERLSARTRQGLEAARRRGGGQGRTAVADVPELKERIESMRAEGMTLQAIADTLNAEGVPTLRGGAMWRPSSVQAATGYRRPSASGRGIELPRAQP